MKNLLLFTLVFLSLSTHAQIITTVAGDSTEGYNGDNILATTAELNDPTCIAIDTAGNLYIVDRGNNRIRKVTASSGIITTIAGTGIAGFSGDNGIATLAQINYPYGIAIDTLGNIFFSDGDNARIRKIDTSGIITTIAGNGIYGYNGDSIMATAAEFESPGGITVDRWENIYVAVYNSNMVRKISPSGIITTVAGTGGYGHSGDNGMATAATLNNPNDVNVDAIGNLYIADYSNNRVRKVDTSGIITTFAGNGTYGYNGDDTYADSAEFRGPVCIATDGHGSVYISDVYNQRLRKVSAIGIITTYAGDGTEGYLGDNGPATEAELRAPVGVAVDGSGTVYIADAGNNRIRRIGWPLGVPILSASSQSIIIYPDPAITTLTVRSQGELIDKVTITDLMGRVVNTTQHAHVPQVIIDVSALPNALYLVRVNGSDVKKFIKE